MSYSILSTKKLTFSQQELVLHTGLGIVHFNILETHTLPVALQVEKAHIIITSKNAIPGLLNSNASISKISCVGAITAALLKEKGFQPYAVGNNSIDLFYKLKEVFASDDFVYLCSDHRRDELPALFLNNKIPLKEIIAYRSVPVFKSFDRTFAAVTFYSPRGVLAFAKANPKAKSFLAICIGTTTATTANDYYENVIIANKQTVENTLITAIKAVKND